ncbi:MAG: lysine exporter LysO family protein [Epulopiscium sp.]|nr:lysine exporter LysO family protein [Candidatus Epulonipiscium sp.]
MSNIHIKISFSDSFFFLVGIDIGSNKQIFQQLRKVGIKVLLVPISIILGSWLGGMIGGWFLRTPQNMSGAIASGF